MKYLLAFLFFSIAAFPVLALEARCLEQPKVRAIEQAAENFSCRADSDCLLIHNYCGKLAVNRKGGKAISQVRSRGCMQMNVDCMPPKQGIVASAKCVEEECRLAAHPVTKADFKHPSGLLNWPIRPSGGG